MKIDALVSFYCSTVNNRFWPVTCECLLSSAITPCAWRCEYSKARSRYVDPATAMTNNDENDSRISIAEMHDDDDDYVVVRLRMFVCEDRARAEQKVSLADRPGNKKSSRELPTGTRNRPFSGYTDTATLHWPAKDQAEVRDIETRFQRNTLRIFDWTFRSWIKKKEWI